MAKKTQQTKEFELIDEKFDIVFEFSSEVEDFRIMNALVKWCNSYVRHSILHFDLLKDLTNYAIFLERDNQFNGEYIKKIRVYVRKPSHRLEWEDKKIQEFKDFISKKFRKANPIFQDWIEELNLKDSIGEQSPSIPPNPKGIGYP
jgi:hypothetical protein